MNLQNFLEKLETAEIVKIHNSFTKTNVTIFAIQVSGKQVELMGLKPTSRGYRFNTFIVDTWRYLKTLIIMIYREMNWLLG